MSTKTDTTSGLAAPVAAGKTFDAVLAELVQPFDPESVEFKAGATTQDKARALALAYVDSRVYQARLDAVAPDWHNEYTREYAGDRVIITCRAHRRRRDPPGHRRELAGERAPRRQHRDRRERCDYGGSAGLQARLLRLRPRPLPLLGPASVGRLRQREAPVHARGGRRPARDAADRQVRGAGRC